MNKFIKKLFSSVKNSGFTLIELLVVVLIIGILAAVAVPQYQFAVYKARLFRLAPMLKSIKQANQVFYMANGYYTNDFTKWDIDFPSGTQFSGSEQGSATITLPDGTYFIPVSSPVEGVEFPRVQGYVPNVPASLWTAYESDRWACYPQGEIGRRLCKVVGCKDSNVPDGVGCSFSL